MRAFLKAGHIFRKNHPVLSRTCPNMPVNLEPVGIVECAARDNAEIRKPLNSHHDRRCAPAAEVEPQPKITFIGFFFVYGKSAAR